MPIDTNKFLISVGDSLILILPIIHPAYLGQADDSCMSISIFLSFEKLNFFTSGKIISLFSDALISLATPRCDAASALFGVSEIS